MAGGLFAVAQIPGCAPGIGLAKFSFGFVKYKKLPELFFEFSSSSRWFGVWGDLKSDFLEFDSLISDWKQRGVAMDAINYIGVQISGCEETHDRVDALEARVRLLESILAQLLSGRIDQNKLTIWRELCHDEHSYLADTHALDALRMDIMDDLDVEI